MVENVCKDIDAEVKLRQLTDETMRRARELAIYTGDNVDVSGSQGLVSILFHAIPVGEVFLHKGRVRLKTDQHDAISLDERTLVSCEPTLVCYISKTRLRDMPYTVTKMNKAEQITGLKPFVEHG